MISVVIPALNEQDAIVETVQRLRGTLEAANLIPYEIIVVDDGSEDETGARAAAIGARVIRHPHNAGYGHSLKDGIRDARYELIAITDADGTYPIESLPELVSLAKSKPGQLSYGTAGSSVHLAVEFFSSVAAIRMNHIPYKGSAPAITDLIGGQLQVLFDPFSSLYPQVRAGKARGLAVTTQRRSSVAPELPTVSELGYKGFDVSSWQGLVVPAATPKEVVDRLHRETVKVLASAEIKEQFAKHGAEPAPTSPEQFGEYIRAEIARWQRVGRDAGVKPE